tara:strand:- start:120717 stop:120947 length:231 start_codon:yes stop_codon:yes gene_type:complete
VVSVIVVDPVQNKLVTVRKSAWREHSMEDFITVPKMKTRGPLSQNRGRLSSGVNVSASLLFLKKLSFVTGMDDSPF